ncbi:MAG: hypothetical protein SNH79_01655 [Rikenellaceae bacterium]
MNKVMRSASMALLVTMGAAMFAGCNVDESYDFATLQTDDLGLGTDDTSFDIPLITVELSAADFLISDATTSTKSVGLDFVTDHWDDGIMGLIYQINSILPTELSGEYADGIDLTRFSEEGYITDLVEAVVEEYATDDAKILDFCEMMLVRAPNYVDEVAIIEEVFGIDFYDVSLSAADCAAILKNALNDPELQSEFVTLFQESIMPGIMTILAEYAKLSVEEELFAVNLSESIYGIIENNVDGGKNYLQIGVAIDTNLPFAVSFDSALVYEEGGSSKTIDIMSSYDVDTDKGIIDNVDVLRAILENVTVKADVSLDSYSPVSDLTLDDKTVSVTLMVRKSGSIKF